MKLQKLYTSSTSPLELQNVEVCDATQVK